MTIFLGFLSLSIVYCCAPGPTVLLVINTGIGSRDRRRLISCIGGILLSNLCIVSVSSLGLGALLEKSQLIFAVIKYLGACYLIYLGLKSLIQSFRQSEVADDVNASSKLAFLQGFLTSITNPKLLLFYMAFLPQFVTGTLAYQTELFCWGIGYVVIVFMVMSSYGLLANRCAVWLRSCRSQKIIKRIVGVSFLGFGSALLRCKTS